MTGISSIPCIICIAPVEYSGLRQRPQVIMDFFAELTPVFYVDPVGLRTFRISDIERIVNKLLAIRRVGSRSGDAKGARVVTPAFVPFHWAESINRRLFQRLGRSLERRTRGLGQGRPLLWIGVPSPLAVHLLDRFPHGATVYDCMDDFPGFHGGAERIVRAEREIMRRADIVFAASAALQERAKETAGRVATAPNGVDIERFRRPNYPVVRPRDLPRGEVVIGYHGTIGRWFDANLVREIARSRPRWQVVLIGPVTCDLDRSMFPPNVHLLGPRPQQDLLPYLVHFDVGIVPFGGMSVAMCSNPIKVYEYLAAGLPVVSSPIHELRLLPPGLIRTAGDGREFTARIEESLAEAGDEEKRRERIAAAETHSWTGVFDGIVRELEKLESLAG